MNLRFWSRKSLGDSWPLDTPPPADWPWQLLSAPDQAVGLPAVVAVIRLLAHAAALVPLIVVRDNGTGMSERAIDTWQWRLLNRRPGPPPMTPFHFKADIAAQFSGRGNAYIRKFTATTARHGEPGPRVVELMPLVAGRVKPRRANGRVVFDDASTSMAETSRTRTSDEIIQIRSFAFEGQGLEGLAPITAARYAVEAGLRRQQFEARHLANGIFPGLGVQFPSAITEEQGKRWAELIEARHQGSYNAGKVVYVGGGATFTPIPISLEDAQFAETTRLTIAQVAAMYQIPLTFMTPGEKEAGQTGETHWRYFLTFALGPLLEAMVQGFNADETLFPPDGEPLEVKALSDGLLTPDPLTKATIDHTRIQSGAKLVDEVRAANGDGPLPPIPDDWQQRPGMVPQITPVGGAPNPTANLSGQVAPPKAAEATRETQIVVIPWPSGGSKSEAPTADELETLSAALGAAFERMPAPQVTVTNDVQPTPVEVSVTNDVQPAAVEVRNEITVDPAAVSVENRIDPAKPKRISFRRNQSTGLIDDAEVSDV